MTYCHGHFRQPAGLLSQTARKPTLVSRGLTGLLRSRHHRLVMGASDERGGPSFEGRTAMAMTCSSGQIRIATVPQGQLLLEWFRPQCQSEQPQDSIHLNSPIVGLRLCRARSMPVSSCQRNVASATNFRCAVAFKTRVWRIRPG